MNTRSQLLMTLVAATMALPSHAEVVGSRLGAASSIAVVHEYGKKRDNVVLEGEVLRHWRQNLYEIEDATGRMITLIPDHVRRETGDPEVGERIRVRGKFDHKALDDDRWGVRVEVLERDRPEPPRPIAEAPAVVAPLPSLPASAAPFQAEAHADRALVEELRLAKERVTTAREALVEAEIAYMRGMAAKLPEPEVSELAQREEAAKAVVEEAIEPIEGLVEQARAEGVSPGLIRMYERQIYGTN